MLSICLSHLPLPLCFQLIIASQNFTSLDEIFRSASSLD